MEFVTLSMDEEDGFEVIMGVKVSPASSTSPWDWDWDDEEAGGCAADTVEAENDAMPSVPSPLIYNGSTISMWAQAGLRAAVLLVILRANSSALPCHTPGYHFSGLGYNFLKGSTYPTNRFFDSFNADIL